MKFVNLHGEPISNAAIRAAEDAHRRGQYLSMVPAPRKPIVKNGYAAQPGTGPAGMTCKQCAHKTTIDGARRSFVKCLLRKPEWTRGGGTDILAGSPACNKFEPCAPT